jgi:omega-6 fatty acid desaturase (delta-12 desaturase)
LAVVAFSIWAVHQANVGLPSVLVPFAWLFYWWYQGITFTGLWVIAHECGHGGFTDSRMLNDAVGFLIHSSLVTPYFSWAITHAKHHHYTNHMTMGETWVPSTADPTKKSVKFAKTRLGTWKRMIQIFIAGWYMYLIFNATGARQNLGQSHFNPKSKALFKPKDAKYVRLSNVGMVIALVGIAMAINTFGFYEVGRTYLVPQMIANFYLCMITFMQHTHEDVPHFDEDQWTWLRGALSTIDRSMGPFCDYKLHHIVDSHVAHHIFSDMPYYGAKEATPYIKAHLGKYYKEQMPEPVLGSQWMGFWRDCYYVMKSAVSVGHEEGSEFLWFK